VADQCAACLAFQEQAVPAGQVPRDRPGFVAPDQPLSCGACIAWHAARFHFPTLWPQNLVAWDLYWKLQDQQRVGGFDVLGLDYTVLPVAFACYAIPRAEWRLLFEKLMTINREVAAHRARRQAAQRAAAETAQWRAQGRTRLDV
jgi:hypothetical protein